MIPVAMPTKSEGVMFSIRPSAFSAFGVFCRPLIRLWVVVLGVLRFISKEDKVTQSVVCSCSVLMMDYFFGKEDSPKMLFHYKTMFKNVYSIVGIWMRWGVHSFVPRFVYCVPMLYFALFGKAKFPSSFRGNDSFLFHTNRIA